MLSLVLSKTRKGFGKETDVMHLNFLPEYISCIGKNVPFRVTLNVVVMVLLSFHPATEVILLQFGARVLLQHRKNFGGVCCRSITIDAGIWFRSIFKMTD